MASKMIELKAKANILKIDAYRTMSEADLVAAIAKAEGKAPAAKSAPVKGAPAKVAPAKTSKTSAPGAKGQPAAKSQPSAPAASKTSTSAPAKSAPQKPAPAKGQTAAKGTAKSPTAGGKAAPAKTAPVKKAPAAAKPAAKAAPAKTKTAPTEGKTAPVRKTVGGKTLPKPKLVQTRGKRNTLNHSEIDWTLDAGIGSKGGKRGEIMSMLVKHSGDTHKILGLLDKRGKGAEWYPSKPKGDKRDLATYQLTMLTWIVNRVAFDYALKTGQHKPGSRVAYGTRDTTPKPRTTSTPGPKPGSKAKTAGTKSAPAAPKAQKTAPAVKKAPVKEKAAPAARKPAAARTARPASSKPAPRKTAPKTTSRGPLAVKGA